MNNNNPIQPNTTTPIHPHPIPPLELQAVGGAMRLGRKKDGLDAIRQQALQSVAVRRILQQMDDIPANTDQKS
jgi:hypothetical protein